MNQNFNLNNIFIIIICVNLLLTIYLLFKLNKTEHFATPDQLNTSIKTIYQADIQAIRNLSDIALSLQKGGLTVPGNMSVTGVLSNNSMDFGYGDTAREGSAGKIQYGTLDPTSLCIVGKGTAAGSRSIHMWDNVIIDQNLTAKGALDIGKGINLNQSAMYFKTGNPYHGIGYAGTIKGGGVDGPILFGAGGQLGIGGDTFKPILTWSPTGITINGDLIVTGNIRTQSNISVDGGSIALNGGAPKIQFGKNWVIDEGAYKINFTNVTDGNSGVSLGSSAPGCNRIVPFGGKCTGTSYHARLEQ
jgi:hypothetical protein